MCIIVHMSFLPFSQVTLICVKKVECKFEIAARMVC